MPDASCPYCGTEVEVNHDGGYGYEEGEIYQQECGECGKVFTYTTSILFLYETYTADCLNGDEHDYRETLHYPRRFTKLRCEVCGDEKPLPTYHPFLRENNE